MNVLHFPFNYPFDLLKGNGIRVFVLRGSPMLY